MFGFFVGSKHSFVSACVTAVQLMISLGVDHMAGNGRLAVSHTQEGGSQVTHGGDSVSMANQGYTREAPATPTRRLKCVLNSPNPSNCFCEKVIDFEPVGDIWATCSVQSFLPVSRTAILSLDIDSDERIAGMKTAPGS